MKTISLRIIRITKALGICLLFIACTCISYAQPTWGPVAPTVTDNIFNISGSSAIVNCDMYTDMETGTPTDYVTAIAWSHNNGGTHEVWVRVTDHFSSTVFNIQVATNANSPDVIIGDDGSGVSGNLKVALVYRDFSGGGNDIQYVEIPFTNMCNPSGGGVPAQGAPSAPFQLNTNTASTQSPHIDAYPDPAGGYWGISNPYRALTKFAITWSEEFSTSKEVWIANGNLTGGGVTGINKATDGTGPDVGAVYDVPNARDIAYIVYTDHPSGDLMVILYDISATTSGATTTLETSPHGLQRIDAANVQNTVTIPWVAVAQLGSGSSATIRSYDPVNGTFDYAVYNPIMSPGAAGFKPVIATGPGPDDYNGLTTDFGNNKYLEMFTIDIAELEATDYDATSGIWGGYYEVNMTALNTSSTLHIQERGGKAVSTSSNCGVGHIAAWANNNGSNFFIGWKVNTGTTASFKPAAVNSIVKHNFSTYPNPAADIVGIKGLKTDAPYTAVDITGKTILAGIVYVNDPKIDVSKLSPGLYIFSFSENGETHKLKFVKK